MDDRTRSIITTWGFTNIFWDVDTQDYTTDGFPAKIPAIVASFNTNIKTPSTFTNGVIALEHDYFEGGVTLFNNSFSPQVLALGYKVINSTVIYLTISTFH